MLELAAIEGVLLHVVGTLDSSPSTSFSIEFFASPSCDESGFGEGQVFLGSSEVSTDANGAAGFDVELEVPVEAGWVLTATATREPIGVTSELSRCIDIEGSTTAIADGQSGPSDRGLRLLQSYPNPFRTATTIGFELQREEAVRLEIYDVAGRLVRVLVDGTRTAGQHGVVWDGRSEQGRRVAAGVYSYRIRVDGQTAMRQLLFTR